MRFAWLLMGLVYFSIAIPAESSPSTLETKNSAPIFADIGSDDSSISKAHWALSVEAISLKRSNSSVNQPLVSTLPGTDTFGQTAYKPTAEVFNSNQFQQGSAIGPKFTLEYSSNSDYGVELSYFGVQNLNANNTIGPSNPGNWYVMKAPGSFWQTQDFAYQGMNWSSSTSLYSAEATGKIKASDSFNFLAGVRWLQLKDSLIGSVTPGDQNIPLWKTGGCAPLGADIPLTIASTTLSQTNQACASGDAISGYPPFWTTNTSNNLFGLQLGAQGRLFEIGRLSFGGSLKVGAFNNQATQNDAVSITKVMYLTSATVNRMAYAGEGVIQLKYLITDDLSIKMGYQMLWLNQVALAPGQIPYVYSGSSPTSVNARGVNTSSSILFQGGTVGLEYLF
ncbi:hypothetical protein [Polynucleobacter sp. MWH-UH2A]|uniref:hypothetical protein n=1 Tax=Polynucleobacter sp. MWH-UH2A TaxID=1855617 RepID=UPI001BFEE981|nr:hypothetical protein [Polynucleobacter sp. MWH-UH2A]QWD63847.1 hypothetical protein IC571_09215 [Polynucleobacter sp. MWH-UH2A]